MGQIAETVADAIAALGGTKAVADRFGKKPQAVSNWRTKGFPSNTYVVLQTALNEIGWSAPATLWGMATDKAEFESSEPSSSSVNAA